MFSPIYSAGGVYVPHPMFVPLQGGAGTSRGVPFFPPMAPHSYPFPYFPPGQMPRMMNSHGAAAQLNGDSPQQLRKLFIGGLSHDTTDEQLRTFYSQWGTVVDCIVIRDPQTKYSRGFGFVTFATVQMAEAAMTDRPHTINNKVVDPKRAIPREQMSPLLPNHPPPFLDTEPDPGCKLTLSGIHWDYHTVDSLRHYFDTFGVVEQIEILGNPRGFGFVVFEEKTSAERCLANGQTHMVNGRKCDVAETPLAYCVNGRGDMYELMWEEEQTTASSMDAFAHQLESSSIDDDVINADDTANCSPGPTSKRSPVPMTSPEPEAESNKQTNGRMPSAKPKETAKQQDNRKRNFSKKNAKN